MSMLERGTTWTPGSPGSRPSRAARGGWDARPLVVLGVGNVLAGDDGVGPRAIEALAELLRREPGALPPGTRLLDGGTLGLGLIDVLDGAGALLVLDALRLNLSPGSVVVLHGQAVLNAAPAAPGGDPGGVSELLGALRLLDRLPVLAMVGIEADTVHPGLALSEPVRGALPVAVEAARREAWALAARIEGARA